MSNFQNVYFGNFIGIVHKIRSLWDNEIGDEIKRRHLKLDKVIPNFAPQLTQTLKLK